MVMSDDQFKPKTSDDMELALQKANFVKVMQTLESAEYERNGVRRAVPLFESDIPPAAWAHFAESLREKKSEAVDAFDFHASSAKAE